MKKILITGAAGFLGSHLCERFLKEKFYVLGMDNFITGSLENINFLKKQENFEFALEKNNQLVEEYIYYREKHFKVIKRQFTQLIGFKVIITASLLLIGGYLVLLWGHLRPFSRAVTRSSLEKSAQQKFLQCR